MKIADIQIAQAFSPAERDTADTQYNGTATLANAVGIPLGNANRSLFELSMGEMSISITSIVYSVHTSSKSTGNLTTDLTALENAVATLDYSDANSLSIGSVEHKNIVVPDADEQNPQYLFVKRVQTGAFAVNDSVNVIQTEHDTQPVDVLADGDYVFDI